MFKGVSHYTYTFLWSAQPLPLLSLNLLPPTPTFQQLSIYILISSTFTSYAIFTDALLVSFPFPLSPSSIEWFHYYKHVLYLSLYIIMHVFVYMFIFWNYLPCMRENIWPLCFWAWLTSLIRMSSNCIHLPSNHIPHGWVILHCVCVYIYIYITFCWYILQL
jgi:hypothetical protein